MASKRPGTPPYPQIHFLLGPSSFARINLHRWRHCRLGLGRNTGFAISCTVTGNGGPRVESGRGRPAGGLPKLPGSLSLADDHIIAQRLMLDALERRNWHAGIDCITDLQARPPGLNASPAAPPAPEVSILVNLLSIHRETPSRELASFGTLLLSTCPPQKLPASSRLNQTSGVCSNSLRSAVHSPAPSCQTFPQLTIVFLSSSPEQITFPPRRPQRHFAALPMKRTRTGHSVKSIQSILSVASSLLSKVFRHGASETDTSSIYSRSSRNASCSSFEPLPETDEDLDVDTPEDSRKRRKSLGFEETAFEQTAPLDIPIVHLSLDSDAAPPAEPTSPSPPYSQQSQSSLTVPFPLSPSPPSHLVPSSFNSSSDAASNVQDSVRSDDLTASEFAQLTHMKVLYRSDEEEQALTNKPAAPVDPETSSTLSILDPLFFQPPRSPKAGPSHMRSPSMSSLATTVSTSNLSNPRPSKFSPPPHGPHPKSEHNDPPPISTRVGRFTVTVEANSTSPWAERPDVLGEFEALQRFRRVSTETSRS
ncbi:hypothetical protein BDK51DRAFT_39915 [Blyttiomyces helicus]|uniref:Uncharacterized protein n=1 Tax=Blyttiomyces helicus TaxID=388810 RepID=A0A4P9WCD2_9FUNG|nr:hypothetical protein BDK51DRAFT_39915 [Blyttiomyces helicus]|eukprot:RKO88868.1 hypothetical protein BDK51DRAFT_39915 [Blyttiomyces helicus]